MALRSLADASEGFLRSLDAETRATHRLEESEGSLPRMAVSKAILMFAQVRTEFAALRLSGAYADEGGYIANMPFSDREYRNDLHNRLAKAIILTTEEV